MSTGNPDFPDVKSGSSTVPGAGGTGSAADFSNVKSGSSTVPGGGASGAQTYTVEKGDTLSQFYGQAGKWNAIFAANRDRLDDPDRIAPGQVLKIPAPDDSAGR